MPASPRPLHPELSPRHRFGAALRASREAAGLSQRELGEAAFCSGHLIGRIEKAERWPHPDLVRHCDVILGARGQLLAMLPSLAKQRADVSRDPTTNGEPSTVSGKPSAPVADDSATVWPGGEKFDLGDSVDTLAVTVQFDGREVVMQVDRRALLGAGLATFIQAFALLPDNAQVAHASHRSAPTGQLVLTSEAHLDEVLVHLAEQWHLLVRTDNLLGPQYALGGVVQQLGVIDSLLQATRTDARRQILQLGARYAESAAWLSEESANSGQASAWTNKAMQWAYEADDAVMVAWTMYRRSQQAVAARDPGQAISLAHAARRDEGQFPSSMRAAIRVQEAAAYSLDGDERQSNVLLDEAHEYAVYDTAGDAREGHGAFCTPAYIEISRAECWMRLGEPRTVIVGFNKSLETLPVVYQRDRAARLTQLGAAYAADSRPEDAAFAAHAALPIARSAGSRRIIKELQGVGASLGVHRRLPAVAAFIDDLRSQD